MSGNEAKKQPDLTVFEGGGRPEAGQEKSGGHDRYLAGCGTSSQILVYVEGGFCELDQKRFERHLSECRSCLRKVAACIRILNPEEYRRKKPGEKLLSDCIEAVKGRKVL